MRRRLATLALVLVVACWPFGARAPIVRMHELVVDTTVLIVRVFNYQPAEVTAYLDGNRVRNRIGSVEPMHEGFFVMPSVGLVGLTAFVVTVISADSTMKPYRTGLIQRNPGKIAMVYVEVGNRPTGPGQWRQS